MTIVLIFKGGEDLRHSAQLLSRFNLLETELKVQMSKVTVGGWLDLQRRTYNGRIGGATWRVKPGDTISVRLVSCFLFECSQNFEIDSINSSLDGAIQWYNSILVSMI